MEPEVQRAPSPPPVVPRKPPSTPAELEEYLLGSESQGLARALAGRVNPGYHRSETKYVSSTKRDFDDPRTRNEPVEPVSKKHFHSLDDVGKHGASGVALGRARHPALTRRGFLPPPQRRRRCVTPRC